jgi:radical SAM superfamily enzyme YgiQ (UPF0313 family)
MQTSELHLLDETESAGETGAELPGRPLAVCLVTAFNLADLLDPELTAETARKTTGAQLGVLTLAAILRNQGHAAVVVNLDSLFLEFLERRKRCREDGNGPALTPLSGQRPDDADAELSTSFFSFAANRLRSVPANVFGFSSICSSYPLTLRLATEIKRCNPGVCVVLGGPQASVVDVPTMHAFPAVDFILRGEADETIGVLVESLARGHGWDHLPGLTFRRGSDVVRNPNAPVVADLDRLPMPAFDMDVDVKNRDGLHLELGRGCPFACTFCSTNDFFRRNFRLKSPEKLIQEMDHLHREYGITYFSLVHDMFVVDRKRVVAFCRALLAHGSQHTWGCSARTDCIDDELIGLMAEAGCRGIFFGIETGSSRLQKVIRKNLDLDEAMQRIKCADRHEIKTAVALIIGFPDETPDDLRDSMQFFVNSTRFDHAEPQMSLLAPLAGTPLHEEYKNELTFDRIYSDISYQGWVQDSVEEELIRVHPTVFPNFYAIPTRWLDRQYLSEARDFVTYLTAWFRWLPVALLQDSGDLLRVFDRWRAWSARKQIGAPQGDTGTTPYHCRRQFREDFLEFVRDCYLNEMSKAPAAVTALLQTEGFACAESSAPATDPIARMGITGECFPTLISGALLLDLAIDYKALIIALRTMGDLTAIPERGSTVLVRRTEKRRLDVWQLAPLAAALLRLCDGTRSIVAIADVLTTLGEPDLDVEPMQAVLFGLHHLRERGFVTLATMPRMQADAEVSLVEPLPPALGAVTTQQPWPPAVR